MASPVDMYRQGYEQGQSDGFAGHLEETVFGLFRDDPGRYYEAGYHDGAAGKPFQFPGEKISPPPEPEVPLSEAESAWFRLCREMSFISVATLQKYAITLQAAGHSDSFRIGLADFAEGTCPQCRARGEFKIHFLGRLKHPRCGWSGYLGPWQYILHQISQIFRSGASTGGSMKKDADRKGDRSGGWIYGIFGFFTGAMIRTVAACVLIPLQMILGLLSGNQSKSDVISRSLVLSSFALAASIGIYQIQKEIKSQQAPQSSTFSNNSASSVPQFESASANSSEVASNSVTTDNLFAFGADYESRWTQSVSSASVSVDGGLLQIQVPMSGGVAYFVAKSEIPGDSDTAFSLNHQGFGRTTVGIWSTALDSWQAWADLDTDDKPCLYINSRNQSSASYCPSDPYLNRPLNIQIRTMGSKVEFYLDAAFLNSFPLPGPGPYYPAFSVGDTKTKSGDNITTIYSVSVKSMSLIQPKLARVDVASGAASERLPVDIERHCKAHGYQGSRNVNGTGYGWVCTPADTPISVEQACREQYGESYSAGLASPPPGGINDWFCHK